jgi:hypothetical protein
MVRWGQAMDTSVGGLKGADRARAAQVVAVVVMQETMESRKSASRIL